MSAARAARGAHYTPPHVARYLAEQALGEWLTPTPPTPRGPRVLDPACGDGALLLAVGELLVQRVDASSLGEHLHGIDIDPQAVSDTRAQLTRRFGSQRWNVAVGNALFDHALLTTPFDVIIGNPPYVFGEHLAACDRSELAARFQLAKRGQPDLYQLFYERTLELLRPRGRHAFLVPDAILARDEHGATRRHVVERLDIERVCQVGRVFETAAGVASVVIAGARDSSSDTVAIDRWNETHPVASHSVPRAWLTPRDGTPWCTGAPRAWFGPDGFRAQLERHETPLASLLADARLGLTRGEEIGKRSLSHLSASDWEDWGTREPAEVVPIYAGESVRRHRLGPPTRYTARTAIIKDPRYYAAPKVLFVKTGAGPVAATSNDDFPVLQSVYTLHLDRGGAAKRVVEDALVAVLCSAVLTTYCWHRWTFGKRLQPQFTIDNVRSLPMPPLTKLIAASDTLAEHVHQIRHASETEAAARERELDIHVAHLYGIELDDWSPVVNAALAHLPASQRSRWYSRDERCSSEAASHRGSFEATSPPRIDTRSQRSMD